MHPGLAHADVTAGNPCRGSGAGDCGEVEPPMPPRPSPPTRLPRCGSGYSSRSSGSLSSPSPGTPGSLASESLRALHRARGPLPLQSELEEWCGQEGRQEQEDHKEQRQSVHKEFVDKQLKFSAFELASGQGIECGPGERRSAELRAIPAVVSTVAQAPDSFDCGDCCFRDVQRICGAMREEWPQTAFDMDVAHLELRCLLRRHKIEPSEELVGNLLMWQARTAQSLAAAVSGAPPVGLG